MQFKRKEKCNIRMNEVLNRHLDSKEDEAALDVFKPKIGEDDKFFNLIEQAIDEDSGEREKKGKRNSKAKVVRPQNSGTIACYLLSLILLSLFGFFLYIAWNILF